MKATGTSMREDWTLNEPSNGDLNVTTATAQGVNGWRLGADAQTHMKVAAGKGTTLIARLSLIIGQPTREGQTWARLSISCVQLAARVISGLRGRRTELNDAILS